MSLRHTIKFKQMPFRLVPKILDAINMIFGISKSFGIVDSMMLEITDMQNIVFHACNAGQSARINIYLALS